MLNNGEHTPSIPITLPELRVPIDHANHLLLIGFALCFTEPVATGHDHLIAEWQADMQKTEIPQEVIAHIVVLLEFRMLTTNPTMLRIGLETIYHALQTRFWTTRKVGELKAAHALPSYDPDREAAILQSVSEEIRQRGLPSELTTFFSTLMAAVRAEHEAISQSFQ
ncbi:chorismate mutase [Candidatus Woesebacteria bacterium]|nr:chorismate mutase [Candidatus Woesebacteria bacterium]